MQVVMLSEFGPPAALRAVDVADPVPGPGQVAVRVAFANITFVETQVRAGRPPSPATTPRLPQSPSPPAPTSPGWPSALHARAQRPAHPPRP